MKLLPMYLTAVPWVSLLERLAPVSSARTVYLNTVKVMSHLPYMEEFDFCIDIL